MYHGKGNISCSEKKVKKKMIGLGFRVQCRLSLDPVDGIAVKVAKGIGRCAEASQHGVSLAKVLWQRICLIGLGDSV